MTSDELQAAVRRAERIALDLVERGHPSRKAGAQAIMAGEAADGLAVAILPRLMPYGAVEGEMGVPGQDGGRAGPGPTVGDRLRGPCKT